MNPEQQSSTPSTPPSTQPDVKKNRLVLPIVLMVWPAVVLLLTLLGYALGNAVSPNVDDVSVGRGIINSILFLMGAASLLLGLPSFIVGIVLLVLRRQKK